MIRQFSAGGAVYKKLKIKKLKLKIEVLWLVIQPKRDDPEDKIRWQLPKGLVDEGEKMEETAVREVEEEGGVKASVISKIDSVKIFFKNTFEGKPEEMVLKTITFYLMEYVGDIKAKKRHDDEVVEVVWLPFEEAKERLTFKSEKEILVKAKQLLDSSKQESLL